MQSSLLHAWRNKSHTCSLALPGVPTPSHTCFQSAAIRSQPGHPIADTMVLLGYGLACPCFKTLFPQDILGFRSPEYIEVMPWHCPKQGGKRKGSWSKGERGLRADELLRGLPPLGPGGAALRGGGQGRDEACAGTAREEGPPFPPV